MYAVSIYGFTLNVEATSKLEAVSKVCIVHDLTIEAVLTSDVYPHAPSADLRFYTALQIHTSAHDVIDCSCVYVDDSSVEDDTYRQHNMPYKSRTAQLVAQSARNRSIK